MTSRRMHTTKDIQKLVMCLSHDITKDAYYKRYTETRHVPVT